MRESSLFTILQQTYMRESSLFTILQQTAMRESSLFTILQQTAMRVQSVYHTAANILNWFQVVQINNWSCITSPPAYPDVNGDVDVTKTMPTQ